MTIDAAVHEKNQVPYGPKSQVVYADPGYQSDKVARYPLDTRQHAKSAYSYISMPKNAKLYTGPQLKRIKGRIMAALKKFGVTVSAESAGWTFDQPAQVTEALAEHLGMPSASGSWSVRASNGPVDICLSSYSMDPEDLDVILRAAADAACKALAALDPDMDGDVDLPGVSSDTDPDDDAPGESAPDITDPAATAAATTETEDPAMAETTTPAAGSAPAIDPKVLAEAVAAELAAHDEARKARKAGKRAAREKAEAKAARAAAESAAPSATAETEEQRRARLAALVEQQFTAAAAREGLAAVKTDEQLIAEMLEERLVPLRQARAEDGGVHRKGLAALESIADSPGNAKLLESATNEELSHLAAAAFGPRRR
jgi:Family of unknown function (DUF6582)